MATLFNEGVSRRLDADQVIGLRRNTVVIAEHEASWLKLGASRRLAIMEACREISCEVDHVHVVPIAGVEWDSYVLFRNALRADPFLLGQYADLKRRLAKLYPDSRKQYGDGKNGFISATIGRLRGST